MRPRGPNYTAEEIAAIAAARSLPPGRRWAQYQQLAASTGRPLQSIVNKSQQIKQGLAKAPLQKAEFVERPLPNNGVYIDDFGVTYADLITRLRGGSSVP